MDEQKLRELIVRMRQEGETQETTGFPNSAKIARWCADELEAALAANPPEQPQGKHICCWERDDPHRCILCCQCGKKFEPVWAEQQGLTKSNES